MCLWAYVDSEGQISLHIHAVWSEPSLSANRIIGYYRMYEYRAEAQMIPCICAGWSESAHFVHVQRHFFTWCGPLLVGTGIVLVVGIKLIFSITGPFTVGSQNRSWSVISHENRILLKAARGLKGCCIFHHSSWTDLEKESAIFWFHLLCSKDPYLLWLQQLYLSACVEAVKHHPVVPYRADIMVNVLKFRTPSGLTKWKQTKGAVLSGSTLFAISLSILTLVLLNKLRCHAHF